VVIGYTVALAAAILGFWSTPNIAWVQWLSVASVSRCSGAALLMCGCRWAERQVLGDAAGAS
jgi:hypothetical protein